MPNKDEIDAVAKAAAEIVKATPVYQDAVQPVAQEIGRALKTLGGAINVALSPIAAMVYGYESIRENLKMRLEKRLAKTPPENIVVPKLQVVGPLLEKYKYVHDNDDLSQMFINLLANAMDKEKVQKAHPSFVNVISELSPDEARLVKLIAKETVLPKLDIQVKSKTGDDTGHVYFMTNFTLLGEKAALAYPDLTPSYLSNLERLSIISCPVGSFQESYIHKDIYKPLEDHKLINKIRESVKGREGVEIKTVQGIIRITEFGQMFMDAVLAET
ncbi:MAG: DUF4393 domain-containing protein [Candidatus Sungbacteria bacterium]|uniref:DUF4393 domain-containing protein n=1 Tax=Candidatus Sungiibacteriota bacterium TaxID=2750080 RepID=A0A931SAX1_9BACT|nr:DUF4393 domain-containing protein [Candidatus Sungbacteria bacterium]